MGNDRFSKEEMRAVGNNSPFEKRDNRGFAPPVITLTLKRKQPAGSVGDHGRAVLGLKFYREN
jgi:hypothetical protein